MHLQYYALAAAACCLVSVSVAFVPAASPLRRSGPLRAIARRIVDEKAFSNAMYELKKAGAETGPETKKICDGACCTPASGRRLTPLTRRAAAFLDRIAVSRECLLEDELLEVAEIECMLGTETCLIDTDDEDWLAFAAKLRAVQDIVCA